MMDWDERGEHLDQEILGVTQLMQVDSKDAGYEALSRLEKTGYELSTLVDIFGGTIEDRGVTPEVRTKLEALQ